MNTEKFREYQALSQRWVDTYEGFMKAKLNERERLWDEFWPLMDEIWDIIRQEPELKNMFLTLLDEHSFDRFVMRTVYTYVKDEELLEELRAFAHGDPVHFTERSLRILIQYYNLKPEFQQACHADPEVWDAFTYWHAEYHRLIANDEIFAACALGDKLFRIQKHFSFGGYGNIRRIPPALEDDPTCTHMKIIHADQTVTYVPVSLDETELELLYRLYHTNPKCRQILGSNYPDARKVMAYFLEKYEQRRGPHR